MTKEEYIQETEKICDLIIEHGIELINAMRMLVVNGDLIKEYNLDEDVILKAINNYPKCKQADMMLTMIDKYLNGNPIDLIEMVDDKSKMC